MPAAQVSVEELAQVYACAQWLATVKASKAPPVVQLDASDALITAVSAAASSAGLSPTEVFDRADGVLAQFELEGGPPP